MADGLWFTISLIVLLALIFGSYYVRQSLKNSPWVDKALFDRGMEMPAIWLYYDDSQVNSRHWLDFQARSSRALNQPFLNLCYESIVRNNGKLYRVEVIKGINGLAERLGADAMPAKLSGKQGALGTIGPAEKNWMRAAILSRYGGLWLEPTVIALRGFDELPKDKVVFFGTDGDESYAGTAGTSSPGFNAVWVPAPNHPKMIEWEAVARERLSGAAGGGAQVRGDAKWDYTRFFAGGSDYEVRPGVELKRKGKSGRLIQLEDLLAQGEPSFSVPSTAIFCPLPYRDLELRRNWGWFLRMSEEQILESDLVVAHLLKLSLSS